MSNIKNKIDFFDIRTGKYSGDDGLHVWSKKDNVQLLFDSRGEYLGIRIAKGRKTEKGVTFKNSIYHFKPFSELEIWQNMYQNRPPKEIDRKKEENEISKRMKYNVRREMVDLH